MPAGWQTVEVPGIDFGPLLAQAADKLYLAGMDQSRDTVLWSSANGLAWTQLPATGFPKDFVPTGMTEGRGGLLVVGELTTGEQVVPQIWRSIDGGTTFSRATIETAGDAGETVGVAAGDATMVAFGDHQTIGEFALDAWRSNDGVSWVHDALPESKGFMARSVTQWPGGIAVLGTHAGGVDGIWLWHAGSGWKKAAELPTTSVGPILSYRDRLLVLGYAALENVGPVPAGWWSTDGRTWTRALAPVDGVGVMFDGGIVSGERVIAFGMSHIAYPAYATLMPTSSSQPVTPAPSPSFRTMAPTFWVSIDGGVTWRRVGPAPYYLQYHSALLSTGDGHLVFATALLGRAIVSVGDLPK